MLPNHFILQKKYIFYLKASFIQVIDRYRHNISISIRALFALHRLTIHPFQGFLSLSLFFLIALGQFEHKIIFFINFPNRFFHVPAFTASLKEASDLFRSKANREGKHHRICIFIRPKYSLEEGRIIVFSGTFLKE